MEKFRIVIYYHMYSNRVATFFEKMSFICMKITNTFYINGFALSLALKQRLGATQK